MIERPGRMLARAARSAAGGLRRRSARAPERGYALLLVLFLVALITIGLTKAILDYGTQAKREKEIEMIWRGRQYKRAIGLYYGKFGHFPTSMDDLYKGTNGVRFLRQEYKDPMNRADGSWRLIYVTPAGVLIGSVRYTSLSEMAMADRLAATGMAFPSGQPAGAPSGSSPGGIGAGFGSFSFPGAPSFPGSPNSAPGGFPQNPSGGAQPVPSQQGFGGMNMGGQPQPIAPSGIQPQTLESAGPVIGGFIVGVASKINQPSLKVYKGGKTYKQWEFIYNPLEQVSTLGSFGIGATGPGQSPTGPKPGFGLPIGMPPPQPMPPQQPPQ